ncbi:MAG: hypothetical protein ACP5UF_08150 [Hydrogenobaculum sp.]
MVRIELSLIILGFVSIFFFDKDITYFLYMHKDNFKAFNDIFKLISFIGYYTISFFISRLRTVSSIV